MLKYDLEQLIISAVEKSTGKKLENIHLEQTSDEKFGDFASNVAMALSKEEKKNPREVAQAILDHLPENPIVEKTEIAGPGFINFWLTNKAYETTLGLLHERREKNTLGTLNFGKGQTAVTDSSHPNVAKPMGVHHLLSTIIGQSINNLLKKTGYKVIRDNYIGDWGTQFGKLTYAIKTWGDMDKIQAEPIPELLKLYVKFHEESEKDPVLEERGREAFKKLEDGDEESRKLWNWIRDLSLVEFEKIWKRLGVEFDLIHGESFYEDKMPSIIKEGLKKKVIVNGEGGALIIPMNDENIPPCLLQKSDGATTYATRDLARMKYWQDEMKADLGINIVDVAQKLHFQQIFEAAEKLGIKKMKHLHIEFGRMEFPDGSMSTRKGKVVLLENVLDEAEKRAMEKIEEHKSELPSEEKLELARKMGIGAVKYNILSQSRQKNYTFVWDQMLSFEGNSAPYLQYAYTRTQSILKKVDSRLTMDYGPSTISHPEEKTLIKKIASYEEAIEQSTQQFKPNLLGNYLYELAQDFSHFYNNLRILDAEPAERTTRLKLVEATAYVLKNGLEILGIEVPERM